MDHPPHESAANRRTVGRCRTDCHQPLRQEKRRPRIAGERNRRAGQAGKTLAQLGDRKGAPLGTWGPGPFENDAALDWALGLGASGDPDLPQGLLRSFNKLASPNARASAIALAAAEAIAASRGHAAPRLPGEIRQWLAAAKPRADAAAAELALGVLAKVEGEDSELRLLWAEVDGSRWRRTLDDLRRRLREPGRAVVATSPEPQRQEPGPPRIGDVIELLTSTGKAAYVQYV